MTAMKTILSVKTKHKVSYITDIEGNWDFFLKSMEINSTLQFERAFTQLTFKDPTSLVVFGGDMFDKGPGDIRISRLFIDLKLRHWDRVFLIIGNRDANKFRLPAELSDFDVEERNLDEIPAIPCVDCFTPPAQFLKEQNLPNTKASRLKWLLRDTFGSPLAFEFRREELSTIKKIKLDDVTDEDVVESFLASLDPRRPQECFVLDYLRVAQLGLIINDVLIVHGGVLEEGIGFVPNGKEFRYFARETGEAVYKTIAEIPGGYLKGEFTAEQWLEELTRFKNDAVDDFVKNPFWRMQEGVYRRGGEALAAYQNTPATLGTGCVVPTFYETDETKPSRPVVFTNEMLRFYKRSRVNWIMVGHKPVSTCPLVIDVESSNKASGYVAKEKHPLKIIMADTSFSDLSKMKTYKHARGDATHEIELFMSDNRTVNYVQIHGVLPDLKKYNFVFGNLTKTLQQKLNVSKVLIDEENLIGRVTNSDFWVKLKYSETEYLINRCTGRKNETRIVHIDELLPTLL